jgi:hypothetical protein
MHKRRIIAASVLLAPFALAAIFLSQSSKAPEIKPSQVYIWDCEFPEQRPEVIVVSAQMAGYMWITLTGHDGVQPMHGGRVFAM